MTTIIKKDGPGFADLGEGGMQGLLKDPNHDWDPGMTDAMEKANSGQYDTGGEIHTLEKKVDLSGGNTTGHISGMGNFAAGSFGLPNAINHLQLASTYGVGRLTSEAKAEAKRTASDKYANGEKGSLPLGPGYNMMTHLFQRQGLIDKIKRQNEGGTTGKPKIFTDQMEAVKGALAMMGIYGEKNPGGLPIDISEARQIFFGDEQIDKIKETEWRQTIEIGDSKIDPKRIRKFVNHDGSLTWEVLNQDKTVMSRFTLGDYNGTKVFAQGGYKTFAELLKQAKQKVGPNIQGRFDAIRGMFGG